MQYIQGILQDIVNHTHSLGFLTMVKISGTDDETVIESMAEDRSVILIARTHDPVKEFNSTFGLPNLDKLSLHLKNPEYKENAKIEVVTAERNGEVIPVGLHFENEHGDFQNDYRFMNQTIINEKLKTIKFKGATWDIECEPSISSVTRLKLQSAANSDESVFQVKTETNNLIFSFGDAASHAGSFVFYSPVTKKLKQLWAWPVNQVLSILNLDGTHTMKISDQGAMQITVDSGMAKYDYILPALSK